jgi:hypothetical protein
MAGLDASIQAAERAAETDAEKLHLRMERTIYDNLREFVAADRAKREGDCAAAAAHTGRQLEIQAAMSKITSFLGYYPYPTYGPEWEKKRMDKAAAKMGGAEGELVALVPEMARFRADPFDDGRYERWQEPSTDLATWRTLATTSGWDTQGLQDEKGHPYTGLGWYQFDVAVPESAKGKDVFLHGLGVVNEAWVWIDGRYAGHREYMGPWSRPHELDMDVRRLIQPGRTNRITVRVLNNWDVWGANGIYERMFLYARKPAATAPASNR